MKFPSIVLFTVLSAGALFSADKPKPFKTVDLRSTEIGNSVCNLGSHSAVNWAFWGDDTHLVVWEERLCGSFSSKKESFSRIAIVGTDGQVRSVNFDGLRNMLLGPHGQVLGQREDHVEVLDMNLEVKQTIPCPVKGEKGCAVYAARNGTSHSDFAVCSSEDLVQSCKLYSGEPAVMVGSFTKIHPAGEARGWNPYDESLSESMYGNARSDTEWRVSDAETWLIENGMFSRRDAHGTTTPLIDRDFSEKNGGCWGKMLTAAPRMLAVCGGAQIFTDGDLDRLFGYTKIAIVEVPSAKVVARFKERAYTSVYVSPSGHMLALVNSLKLRLFKID